MWYISDTRGSTEGHFVLRVVQGRDFPGGPVVKTLCFQYRGAWVQYLVRELLIRFHM